MVDTDRKPSAHVSNGVPNFWMNQEDYAIIPISPKHTWVRVIPDSDLPVEASSEEPLRVVGTLAEAPIPARFAVKASEVSPEATIYKAFEIDISERITDNGIVFVARNTALGYEAQAKSIGASVLVFSHDLRGHYEALQEKFYTPGAMSAVAKNRKLPVLRALREVFTPSSTTSQS
ncbi:MAG: hypothetical protein HYV40_01730 [Candidatus Levybacteria bacterium]|nr:hypothetical protein [Candidatus Levybacteria bacterium]